MSHLVFIFGTLKEGFPNFHANTGVRVASEFVTVQAPPFYLVGERCSPWLVNSPGQGHQVTGQVFEVDGPALELMDGLERVNEPDRYRRIHIEVFPRQASPGRRVTVCVYLKEPEKFSPANAKRGPLVEYTAEHAALYRGRALTPSSGQPKAVLWPATHVEG